MVIARRAEWASTGLLQDKELNHHARPAGRASMGFLQDKQLKHPARSVPRTRTRLLRTVLKPHARATQATVVTPAQEHVQRVWQESTNLQEAMVIARTVAQASSGLLKDKPLKHRARSAVRASTGLLQDKPPKHRARVAERASTWWKQDEALKHRARDVVRGSTG